MSPMHEERFYTSSELATLSDVSLLEVRSTYQHLYALLEGETAPEDVENRDQIMEMLRKIQEEMVSRGLASTGSNRS